MGYWNDWDRDSPYEAALRMAERERIQQGVPPLIGYKRPVDPACPQPGHGYGVVRGECGMCVLERNAETKGIAA